MEKEQDIMKEENLEKTNLETAEKAKAEEVTEEANSESKKRILQGVVISNKPDKSIIIKVVRQVAHPLYKKYFKKSKKFIAHDENNDCNVGDIVRVASCRPLSKRKTWDLVEIVERAK